MNAIREALGERQVNFYGLSYGTYLGQVFATLYPERMRRMVLDSNVDPRGVWYDANLEQDYAFEEVFQLFLDWVALHDDTYHLGATNDEVEAKYYAAQSALAVSPRGELGAAEWADAFLLAGYVQGFWPDHGTAFAAFVNDDDPAPITELFHAAVDTADDNSYAMYLATGCTDAHWPQRWTKWRRDNDRVAADAPFLTWGNAWFNAPCTFWPARAGNPVTVSGKNARPILLLGETLDGATPLSGSLEIRKRFRGSTLIATEGTTHANSLFGYACVDDAVAAYLLDGSLPPRVEGDQPDVVCPALPLPEPLAADVATDEARPAGVVSDARRLLQLGIMRR